LLIAHHDLFGYTCNQIASVYGKIVRWIIQIFHGSTDLNFNLLGGSLTNQQAVVTTKCFHNISGKFVSRDAYALITNYTGKSNYRNTGSTASNINNHVTHRFFHIYTDTQG